jgi:hypothetical protein
VTANAGSDDVSFLRGTGDGTFNLVASFPAGAGDPNEVAALDFDGDGNLDLAVTLNAGADVSVLLGTGTGGFGPETVLTAASSPFDVAVGDVNRDGREDFVVVNAGAQSSRAERARVCLPHLRSAKSALTTSGPNLNIVVEDFNENPSSPAARLLVSNVSGIERELGGSGPRQPQSALFRSLAAATPATANSIVTANDSLDSIPFSSERAR